MKVCDLTQFYSPVSGGVRRYIEQKAAYIRRRAANGQCSHRGKSYQHVLIVPGAKTEVSGDDVCRVHTIASPLISRTSRYRALINLRAIEGILDAERPDVIESGDPYQVAWRAIGVGRKYGIPVVGFYHSHFPEAVLRSVEKYAGRHIHSLVQRGAHRYIRALYNRFSATFVANPALKALLASWGVKTTVSVDLGVDTEIFRPFDDSEMESPAVRIYAHTSERQARRAALEIAEGQTALLYVGRLGKEKNVKTLFDAFALLAPLGKYRLIVVGDGVQRPHVQHLRGSTKTVTWIPYCSDPHELAAIYRAVDVFVHPSIQETFGLVAIESQACGTPVVGIRGSYMDRIILSDQMSWAQENTPTALAAAIEAECRTTSPAQRLAASEAVRTRFSWERVFANIFETYERVANNDS